ncbi:MAG: lysylphosphatidylglycerol synthase transmembrane domain-containing protein [archaeon]
MRFLKKALPLLGILLLAYVVNKIGIRQIIKSLSEANWLFVFLATLFFIPLIFMQTGKWSLLLRMQKLNLNFFYLLKIQVVGIYYEMITPARVGSLIKIMYLHEKIKNFGKAASSVIIEKFLDFLSVSFLALLGSILLLKDSVNATYAFLVVFVIFLAGFVILTNKNLSRIFWDIAYKIFIPKNLKEKAMNSFNNFYEGLPNLGQIASLSLITLLFWVIVYSQAYIFALAFNVKIPYLEFILIFPISVIISLIPITISGLGTREASLLTLLSKFPVQQNDIVAFSLVWSITGIIVYALPALYLLLRKKI